MNCPRCNAPAPEEMLREFGGVCPKCLLDFSEEQDAPAFPNLEIVEMIGQGGMGVVYKAKQKNLGRLVALKVLSPQLSDDPEFVERFTREARALASLNHPNIVGIYDSGIHDHVPYLVMEYVDGTPLRKLLASGKLTPERVLELIPQVCDALHYAHQHGVVHRDIKPENILIGRGGGVKIADFGLAKLASPEETRMTRSGVVMGSAHYMAPEQVVNSGQVDHRADIYSLGVVFYEMLTGDLPIGRFNPPSERAPVDRRLDPVVLKSLEREPDDRYQSAGEVKESVTDLRRAPADERRDAPRRALPPARPQRSPLVLGCAVILAIGFALVGFFLFFLMPRPAPPPPALLPPPPVFGPAKERPRAVPNRGHHIKQPFVLDDVWPAGTDLPAGFEGAKKVQGAELLRKAELPADMLADLEDSRGLDFQNGRALMVGLQFRTELARRRWQKEKAWILAMNYWHYHLFGNSQAMILIRHDGTAVGDSAKEVLESAVEKKVVEKNLIDR